jgi:hypothetical protein
VKNTLIDPTCSKHSTPIKKPRLTTIRSPILKSRKRNSTNIRQNVKNALRSPSINVLKRKNFDIEEKFHPIITEPPTTQNPDNTKIHRVCYITNWSRYRTGEAKFEVEYIDPFMCTHIIYAYATVDDHKPEIIPIQKEDIGN